MAETTEQSEFVVVRQQQQARERCSSPTRGDIG